MPKALQSVLALVFSITLEKSFRYAFINEHLIPYEREVSPSRRTNENPTEVKKSQNNVVNIKKYCFISFFPMTKKSSEKLAKGKITVFSLSFSSLTLPVCSLSDGATISKHAKFTL